MKKLSFFRFIFLSIFVSSLFLACAGEKTQKKPAATKPTTAKTKKATSTPAKGKKVANKKPDYWQNLKSELKLSDKQLKDIKSINKEVSKKKRALPKVNGKPDAKQLKALNAYQQQRINKILTPEQIKKKTAFDKQRKAAQKAKKKK